jgi:hypothetical protein
MQCHVNLMYAVNNAGIVLHNKVLGMNHFQSHPFFLLFNALMQVCYEEF